MAHKNVSNKAVVKDQAFLAKLGSTMARRGPNPMEAGAVRSQITWKKTSNVKYRLKTLTGTIPIYDDMTEEQIEDVKRKHGLLPGTFPEGIPPPPPGEEEGAISPSQVPEHDYEVMEASSSKLMSTSSTKVQKQSRTTSTSITKVQQESSTSSHHEQQEYMESYTSASTHSRKKVSSSSSKEVSHLASTTKDARVSYIAIEEYTPDDYDGLPLTPGQKVFLLNNSSPNKKARMEGSEDISTGEAPQILDNSLAKQKAAIRPKKNHPSSRSRGHVQQVSPEPQQTQDTSSHEERWLVQDFDTGREGYVPAHVLEISKQAAVVSSIKRSVAELSGEEAVQMKQQMLAQIREFRSRRPQRTLGPTPDDEARAKRTDEGFTRGELLLILVLALVLLYLLAISDSANNV